MKTAISGIIPYLLAALLLAFPGCAGRGGMVAEPEVDPREALLERVHAFQAARMDYDPLALYEMHWSGYRDAVPLRVYVRQSSNLDYKDYHIGEILEFDGKEATLEVFSTFDALGFTIPNRRENQTWVLENGQWFIKIEPVFHHPMGGTFPIYTPESSDP